MTNNKIILDKYTDTHLRIYNELKQFLNETKEFYNSSKHEDTPAISINSLCNIAVMCLKDQLNTLNETEAMTYISSKAIEYDSLRAKTNYINEFNKEEEL